MPEKWPTKRNNALRLSEIKPTHNRQGSITIEEIGGDQDGDKIQPELETEQIPQCYSYHEDGESDKTLSQLSRAALSETSLKLLADYVDSDSNNCMQDNSPPSDKAMSQKSFAGDESRSSSRI